MNIQLLLKDESKFVRRTYQVPIHSQQRVDCEIQSMLENNIIKRSESNFINTLVIVKKKNDDIRLSVDYEKFK